MKKFFVFLLILSLSNYLFIKPAFGTVSHADLTGDDLHDPKAHQSSHSWDGSDAIRGPLGLTNDLTVGGSTHLYDDLTLSGTTTKFYVPDNLEIIGDLDISEDLTVSGTLYGGQGLKFYPESAKLPASNPAVIDGSSNHWKLLYDASTDESAAWAGIMHSYDGENIVIDVKCAMVSATSGTVGFRTHLIPESAGFDIDTDQWESKASVTDTVPGTLGDILTLSAEITSAGTSMATGDWFKLKVERDAAGDSATGDAEVIGVMMRGSR